ncbi:MBOAT family protein [Candidatus Woesebacteria bacterium]|nr:MBOAT family protein [Candidatus Woesebacteria bacterium]MCD8527624.1 MBOAT family protein [Candidatus Woesebacteria bacterium]MCD8546405.1 MBOAT family protein [Candidatus Woesebacteria bacterium]
MLFNSFHFYVFIVLVLGLYWSIPKKWQWVLLLASSYFFYMSWEPRYAVLIFLTTLVSYLCALAIDRYRQQRTLFLALGAAVNLGVLFVFKYFNFFFNSLQNFTQYFEIGMPVPTLSLLLPVGISFYTFQTVSYVVDVYRGTQKPEKHFGYFALFVSFFPQLVAGPIERAENLLPQLKAPHWFDREQVVSGIKLFALGLFKKVVIADNLAVVVDTVFTSLPEYKGLSLILAILLFSWQIYCDFSGYTDMARGVARILGVNLVENFNHPYTATSITDFWRRWHMSLSRWFRDYLYIPLGGNRQGLSRTALNLFIVFALCGLWHGAAWTFVLWGALHGVVMAIERIGMHVWSRKFQIPAVVSMAYTYGVVLASWVLFRAQNLADAAYIYRYALSGAKNFWRPDYIWATLNQVFGTNQLEMAIVLACLAMISAWEFGALDFGIRRWPRVWGQPVVRWTFYSVAVVLIFLLGQTEIQEFIYFQF